MKRNMNKMLGTVLGAALALFVAGQVQAAGTDAGTTISNTASVTFTIGGGTPPAVSGTATFEVDRKVRVVVAKTGNASVDVVPGGIDNVLTFTVTNESNTAGVGGNPGIDYFRLSTVADGSDNFDMSNVRIYEDTGTLGELDGDNELTGDELYYGIDVDETVRFLVVANTPDNATTRIKTNTSAYHLVATAWNGGTAGDLIMEQDTNGNDPLLSEIYFADDSGSLNNTPNNGIHSALGTYVTNWTDLTLTKTATDDNAGYHLPGDIIIYDVVVTNPASENATNVTISDPIQWDDVEYQHGTLTCSSGTQRWDTGTGYDAAVPNAADVIAVQCFDGTVNAGDTMTMQFKVQIR